MAKKPRKLSAYNRFIARELKGKTGPGYKGRFKAAVTKWKRSNKSGSKPRAKAKSSSKSKPKARANPKGGKSTVGKSGFNTQKIFKYVRIGALALPAIGIATSGLSTQGKIKAASIAYFGYNPDDRSFKLGRLAQGWAPFVGAIAVTYGIPKLAGLLRSF